VFRKVKKCEVDGPVITEVGTDPSVAGLVYIAAHMPNAGENEADDGKRFPSDLSKPTAIKKTADGFTDGTGSAPNTPGSVNAVATTEIENQCRGTCAFLCNTSPKQTRAGTTPPAVKLVRFGSCRRRRRVRC